MPENRVPLDTVCALSDSESHVEELAFKNDAVSERSSSPKSEGSVSEVSDTSEASLSIEFSEVSDSMAPQADFLIDDFDGLKLSEEQAEEMAKQGADMRHVLCTSWKLQSKYPLGKKCSSKAARGPPGQALRDMAIAQKKSIEEHERCMRYMSGAARRRFLSGQRYADASSGEEDTFSDFSFATGIEEEPPILVSYADGSNSLTLAEKPLCLHNITVSCAVDSCHVFIQQMKNPTYEGLEPLELAMAEAFEDEAPPPLLRPIAHGSLLAVNMDEKWYRCQVVSFNSQADSCDIKFVDHGGYTTVQVSELRPLRSDFVRLPFQAIEVYVAHVNPASDEIIIDIASDLLFRDNVSIQQLGIAEDGVPIVQAYFYQNDYINLLTQDILDDCYQVFLNAHPDYTPVLREALVVDESASSVDESEYTNDEAASSDEMSPCQFDDQQPCSTDEGVWSSDGSVCTSPEQYENEVATAATDDDWESTSTVDEVCPSETEGVAVVAAQAPAVVSWVPLAAPTVPAVLAYCMTDPNTGLLYYVPVVQTTAPCYTAAPIDEVVPHHEEGSHEEAVDEAEQQYTDQQPSPVDFNKPFEEWTQEDYELYYSQC